MPAAACTSGPCRAASSSARSEDASQPGTRIRSTPDSAARSSTASRSPSNRSCWRWRVRVDDPGQPIGPAPAAQAPPHLDPREDRARGGRPQPRPAAPGDEGVQPGPPAPRSSYGGGIPSCSWIARAPSGATGEEMAEDPARLAHHGEHLANALGPRPCTRSTAPGPRRTVRRAGELHHRGQRLVEMVPLHRRPVRRHGARRDIPDLEVGGLLASSTGGRPPSRYRLLMLTVRLTRLPRSLARSAL